MKIYFKMLAREPQLDEIPCGAWAYRDQFGWMLQSVQPFYGAGSGWFGERLNHEDSRVAGELRYDYSFCSDE